MNTTRTKKYCHGKDEVPKGEHYAIVEFSSVHIPESGVWAPGHGYPAENKPIAEYISFTDETEWKAEVLKLEEARFGKTNYVAFKVSPVVIKTTVEVTV